MPDGCALVADVWLPDGHGPWPTLLQRLPYGRRVASSPVLPSPLQLARQGYAVVVQDVRGTGDSDGEFVPFADTDDGLATLAWVLEQTFSSGSIVMYGFSYQGHNQLQLAARRPKGLIAIAPIMCPRTPYEFLYEDRCRRWQFMTGWGAQLGNLGARATVYAPSVQALNPVDSIGGNPPQWYVDWQRDDPQDAYWSALAADLGAIEVPSFVVLGYADTFARDSSRLATILKSTVVCGPWVHMPWGSRLGDVELGPQAGPKVAVAAFYDFLSEIFSGATPAGTARWFEIGGSWQTGPAWPPAHIDQTCHGASTTGANGRHGDGRLTPELDAVLTDVLVSEPFVPVPGSAAPYPDNSAAEDRSDVLCYTAAPLTHASRIVGTARCWLTVRSDRPTFDVVIALVLVDGADCRQLTIAAQRLSGEPGERQDLDVELGPVGVLVQPGQALRLEVSGTRFPLYDRNTQRATAADRGVGLIELHSLVLSLPALAPDGARGGSRSTPSP